MKDNREQKITKRTRNGGSEVHRLESGRADGESAIVRAVDSAILRVFICWLLLFCEVRWGFC